MWSSPAKPVSICDRAIRDMPEGVHVLSLPPYSPELNPCEQLWDVLKDTEGFANALFDSIEKLRAALLPGLRRFRGTPLQCFP